MLICKFATHRSHPDRIQAWIAYLEELHTQHHNDSDALGVLAALLSEARGWIQGAKPT